MCAPAESSRGDLRVDVDLLLEKSDWDAPDAGAAPAAPTSRTIVSTTSRTDVSRPTPMSTVIPSTSGAAAAATYASATSGA